MYHMMRESYMLERYTLVAIAFNPAAYGVDVATKLHIKDFSIIRIALKYHLMWGAITLSAISAATALKPIAYAFDIVYEANSFKLWAIIVFFKEYRCVVLLNNKAAFAQKPNAHMFSD